MAPKSDNTATEVKSTPADAQIDWTLDLTPTVVPTLKPTRTVESIPETIRNVADQAHESGNNLRVTLPNGIAAKAFCKHLRDYTYLHEPRWTCRTTIQPDEISVAFSVKDYTDPKAKQETTAA